MGFGIRESGFVIFWKGDEMVSVGRRDSGFRIPASG
jgi:hypothetical protein